VTRTTVRANSVRTVRRTNPRRGRAAMLIASRGPNTLRYDGKNFTSSGRPKLFGTMLSAYRKGEHLLKRFPVLRAYKLYVRQV
jgi:hypothetical protein